MSDRIFNYEVLVSFDFDEVELNGTIYPVRGLIYDARIADPKGDDEITVHNYNLDDIEFYSEKMHKNGKDGYIPAPITSLQFINAIKEDRALNDAIENLIIKEYHSG